MKIGDLIQELEKFPADYEVKVNCTVVRKGWQYTYRATLPRDHVMIKKNDEVVIVNPIIIHGYGKVETAMIRSDSIIRTINSVIAFDGIPVTLSKSQRCDLENAKHIVIDSMGYSDEHELIESEGRKNEKW